MGQIFIHPEEKASSGFHCCSFDAGGSCQPKCAREASVVTSDIHSEPEADCTLVLTGPAGSVDVTSRTGKTQTILALGAFSEVSPIGTFDAAEVCMQRIPNCTQEARRQI